MNKRIKISIHADKLPPVLESMLERKVIVKKYHRGEITKEQLHEKGIRFIAPVQL